MIFVENMTGAAKAIMQFGAGCNLIGLKIYTTQETVGVLKFEIFLEHKIVVSIWLQNKGKTTVQLWYHIVVASNR